MPRPSINMPSDPSARASPSPSVSEASTNPSKVGSTKIIIEEPQNFHQMGTIANSSNSSFGHEMSQLDSLTAAAASALEGTEKGKQKQIGASV